MERRRFLKNAGWVVAGGVGAATTGVGGTGAKGFEPTGNPRPLVQMARVLLTVAETRLGRVIATGLGGRYRLRQTSRAKSTAATPWIANALDFGERTRDITEDVDVVIHPVVMDNDDTLSGADESARITYNLLSAAVETNVRRVICLSTLDLLASYDAGFAVTEDWRPEPRAEARSLATCLVENVCREFTRQSELEVLVLRLGALNDVQEADGSGNRLPPLTAADLVRAVSLAIDLEEVRDPRGTYGYSVVHVHSDKRHSRFPLTKAQRVLGFEPESENG